jgi:hypothetical protein
MLKKLILATFVAVSFVGAASAEEVSFEYSSLSDTYTAQDADGGGGGTCVWFVCW